MNLRIQEISEEATEDILGVKVLNQQRFAELIIAECCVALHPMLRDMISRTQAVDMIVSHFRDEQDDTSP
jgi:hypothetical protein